MKQILVLGSLNIDLVQAVPRVPAPGETLQGGGLRIFPGGKGANQACAAAMLSSGGGSVRMAGMVGNDVFADRLLSELHSAGINAELVRQASTPSGSAVILVLPNGDNTIVISPGANGEVSPELATEAVDTLRPGDLLLCQLEVPLAAVQAALHRAHERQIVTILDPAPACHLPGDLLSAVAILTPNQTEAALLMGTGEALESGAALEAAARNLQSRGAQTVIIKMGGEGSLLFHERQTIVTPAFPVTAVDTTAAGDTFNGALAVALAEGTAIRDAVRFASAAAALSVTKAGAIPSIPRRAEVETLLGTRHTHPGATHVYGQ
jgi:ribokinase